MQPGDRRRHRNEGKKCNPRRVSLPTAPSRRGSRRSQAKAPSVRRVFLGFCPRGIHRSRVELFPSRRRTNVVVFLFVSAYVNATREKSSVSGRSRKCFLPPSLRHLSHAPYVADAFANDSRKESPRCEINAEIALRRRQHSLSRRGFTLHAFSVVCLTFF